MTKAKLCSRCGDALPDGPARVLLGRRFCQTCLELPGIDFIAETRRRCLGKEDAYIWLMGGVWLLSSHFWWYRTPSGSFHLLPGFSPMKLDTITMLNACLSSMTLWLWRPARSLWIFSTLLTPLLIAVGLGYAPPGGQGRLFVGAGLSFMIACAAYRSDRNRLAFGIDIPDERVFEVYRGYFDNRAAKLGLVLAAFSVPAAPVSASGFMGQPMAALLLGLLCLPALFLSRLGLQRVDLEAWPPVGQRGQALAGIALSLLGLVLFLGLLVLRPAR